MIERRSKETEYLVRECFSCGLETECYYFEHKDNHTRYFCKTCTKRLKKLRGENDI